MAVGGATSIKPQILSTSGGGSFVHADSTKVPPYDPKKLYPTAVAEAMLHMGVVYDCGLLTVPLTSREITISPLNLPPPPNPPPTPPPVPGPPPDIPKPPAGGSYAAKLAGIAAEVAKLARTATGKEAEQRIQIVRDKLPDLSRKIKGQQAGGAVISVEDVTEAFHCVEALIYQPTPNAPDIMRASAALENLTATVPENASDEHNEVLAACFMLSADLKLRGVYQPQSAGNKTKPNCLLAPNLTKAVEDYTMACRIWDKNGEAHLQVAKLYFQLAVTEGNATKKQEYLELAKIYLSEVTKKSDTSDNYKIARFIAEILVETKDLSDFGNNPINKLRAMAAKDNLLNLDFATTLLNHRNTTDRHKGTALECLRQAKQALQGKAATDGASKTEQEHLTKSKLYLIVYDMWAILQRGADQLKIYLSDLRDAFSAMMPDAFYACDHLANHFQKKYKTDAQQKDFIQKNIGGTDVLSADCSKYAAAVGGTVAPSFANLNLTGYHLAFPRYLPLSPYGPSQSIKGIGLQNTGNTCFMATAIQVMFSMSTISDYLNWAHQTMDQRLTNMQASHRASLTGERDFKLFKEIVDLKQSYNTALAAPGKNSVALTGVQRCLASFQFRAMEQADSSEALMKMLGVVDTFLSMDTRQVAPTDDVDRGLNSHYITWRTVMICEADTVKSSGLLRSLGQKTNQQHCTFDKVRKELSAKESTHSSIIVLHSTKSEKMEDLLIEELMAPADSKGDDLSNTDYPCAYGCTNYRRYTKELRIIDRLPHDLLFYFWTVDAARNASKINKIHRTTNILWNLDMQDYLYSKGKAKSPRDHEIRTFLVEEELRGQHGKSTQYQIKAFAVRTGTNYGGHYLVYKRQGNDWFSISDSNVELVTEQKAKDALKVNHISYASYERVST